MSSLGVNTWTPTTPQQQRLMATDSNPPASSRHSFFRPLTESRTMTFAMPKSITKNILKVISTFAHCALGAFCLGHPPPSLTLPLPPSLDLQVQSCSTHASDNKRSHSFHTKAKLRCRIKLYGTGVLCQRDKSETIVDEYRNNLLKKYWGGGSGVLTGDF